MAKRANLHPRTVRRPRWRHIAATVFSMLTTLGLASVAAPARGEIPVAQCLWAGAVYPHGDAVTAGGWEFVCHAEGFASARWSHAPAPGRRSSVHSPGVQRNPMGAYSPGAFQPGSEYNDYCVGAQLIEGTDDLFEVVDRGGFLMWRSVGPVSQWRFDQASPRPQATWRSSSLCIDGSLT
ncbi:hypothetical protein [Nocardia tengchongensis]|uniref:hypothetical protein n=1 Tax=Nocardia tengchongensis TaxID=2055889 RepID=UPI0036CB9790